MTKPLNQFSARITQPRSQGASQAMLYGTGLTDKDMHKPQVGISSMWYEGNTCNMHLNSLAARVKEGVVAAGMVGMRFNTIGVSDGISMGTEGMSFSLQSRDLIADSIETVMHAQWYDANISIPGCDKNMPGCMMAMGRVNRPSLMVYGGTIKPGCISEQKLDVVSAFQSYGEYLAGTITDEQRADVVKHSCPGAGACGGMYTANTMAAAIETMGMSLPYSASIPAEDPAKSDECFQAGVAILRLLEQDIKPRDIMTRTAFENAMVMIMVLGGSTNAVLHLIAIARSVDVDLTIDDFQKVSDRVPYLAELKPSGLYVMADLHQVGGTPAVLKYLLEQGLVDGDCLTVTTKTLADNVADLPPLAQGQKIIRSVENPIKDSGHLQILKGSLAPEGAVAKITGLKSTSITGPARVFDDEQSAMDAILSDRIRKGDVLVLRYLGPRGGPGMPEMLAPTSAIIGRGLGADVGLITDGRFSGGSWGMLVGHVTPEAFEGGTIALVEEGDTITIDASRHLLQLEVDDAELEKRRKTWKQPEPRYRTGVLGKFSQLATPANKGAVTG